jgi:hypothetical protein
VSPVDQSLSFQNSSDPVHDTDNPHIIVKVSYSRDVPAIAPTAPNRVSTEFGSHAINWLRIDNRSFEGTIDLSHKAQDQTFSLMIPASGTIRNSNQIQIRYKTKYKQYSFGLEYELKRLGAGKITKRRSPIEAKLALVEKTLLAKSMDGPKGLPLIKLVTDDVDTNEACIEVVSGAMAFGFNPGDQYEQKILYFKKSLNLLINSIEHLRNEAGVGAATILPLSRVIDHYNGLIAGEADPRMGDYRLNLEVNADGSLFFIEGAFQRTFGRTPQVNWAFPIARIGDLKPGAAADLTNPTHFSDMFGQTQQHDAYTFRRNNLIRFQGASERVVQELQGGLLADATLQEKNQIQGAFTLLLWESLNQSYKQCSYDILTFASAQDPANLHTSPEDFRNHMLATHNPGWINVTNNLLALPLWSHYSTLQVINLINSLDYGAGKNIYDNLPKSCLEDIANKSVPERFKQSLRNWWRAGGKDRVKVNVRNGDPEPGFIRGFADNAPAGPEINLITNALTMTTIFNYCDNWLFAMIADEAYDPAVHKAAADSAMWSYFGEKLERFAIPFFNYREPGNNSCQMGTSRDSEIGIEDLGENSAEPSVVFEMRNNHPLDQFDYSGTDQSWSDVLSKWRTLLKIPSH